MEEGEWQHHHPGLPDCRQGETILELRELPTIISRSQDYQDHCERQQCCSVDFISTSVTSQAILMLCSHFEHKHHFRYYHQHIKNHHQVSLCRQSLTCNLYVDHFQHETPLSPWLPANQYSWSRFSTHQVSFHGRYNDRECGIRINSASVEDTGTWRLLVSWW